MPERTTAAERLARVLYLLPAAARDGGVPIAELAAALGVSEREVLADVAEVTAREYYHPAGWVVDVSMTVDQDRRLHVRTSGAFRRPVRLSPRETLALGLGLRALAAEAEPARRAELLALATRLETELAAPAIESHAVMDMLSVALPQEDVDAYHRDVPSRSRPPSRQPTPPDADRFATVLASEDEDILSIIVEAARERRVCRLRYLKAGAAAPEDREVHPYHLVHAEGHWYLLAHAVDRDAVRAFRLDRVLEAELRSETFDAPANFDPSRHIAEGGKLFLADDDVEVAVRYSRRIARWVEERVACEPADDGSVVVRHRVADPRWVVRHVLQYGADAEVLEPAEVRGMVGEAARRLAVTTPA